MPFIKSLVSKYYAHIIAVIFSLNKIMPMCSHYAEKKLVYIIITAPSSRQPSFCFKYTKSNIRSSCDIKSVFNTECIFRFPYNIHSLSQLLDKNT